ncbi:MAG: hypothetical protein Q7V01_09625 [Vicinamibacterales bacterium]|nr:hypothetical protein [Vicinamibacterales bacterium]
MQPVVDALLERWPRGGHWLGALWEMAALRRPGQSLPKPETLGRLVPAETPRDPAARTGSVYDRPLAPPVAFLQWLIEHPGAMTVGDPSTFGAKSDDARGWRTKLFSTDADQVAAAQAEALSQLGKRLAQRGRNKWWAFEGFARVDCCLVTDACVLVVDGKCLDGSPSTVWFPRRTRVWRLVEAVRELAGERQFAVILAVDDDAAGAAALAGAQVSLGDSFPHLDAGARTDLSRHLLGFVTPADLAARFGLEHEER